MSDLEKYYNKFNEEKRLQSRHGIVEFTVTMNYIRECIGDRKDCRILDVGAGTGRYSVELANEGYDVTAVELVKYNLGILKAKKSTVKAYQGNALDLSRFEDESFDVTLVFGPMYHLHEFEEKVKALEEAKRVTKKGGYILVAYYMNEYSVIMYGFKDNNIKECIEKGMLTEDFKCTREANKLYSMVRMEDIYQISEAVGLERIKTIAPDGAADYMRPVLNSMDEETFELFIKYQMAVSEREELLGASSHTVDILMRK